MSVTGSVTLNDISMPQLIHILQAAENNKHFLFNPQVMQPVAPNQQNPLAGGTVAPHQRFNAVNLAWMSGEGLETLIRVLEKVHAKPQQG